MSECDATEPPSREVASGSFVVLGGSVARSSGDTWNTGGWVESLLVPSGCWGRNRHRDQQQLGGAGWLN